MKTRLQNIGDITMSENKDLMLDVSQAAELKLAFRRHGWTNADIKKLSEGKILGDVLKVLKGAAVIKTIDGIIDGNAAPYCPPDFMVEKHRKNGFFKFNPTMITLFVPGMQKEKMTGDDLRKKLSGKSVMNANVLDYLLTHPKLIPESWKGRSILFGGTIYRSSAYCYCFRCLHWHSSQWHDYYQWFDCEVSSDVAVALTKGFKA